jgi:hypothetical protein
MCGFVPLVGRSARKSMSRVIRQWRLGRRTDLGFRGLAAIVNPVVSGWINYYGRFYKSELVHFLEQRINPFLVKWMVRKYKRLRPCQTAGTSEAGRGCVGVPGIVRTLATWCSAYWLDGGSRVKGDFHARF